MSQPPQKRPRHEAPKLPTHSKEFPEGYGDFVFKSSDGVVFHFPRFLLTHVSPVFKQMLAVGDGAQKEEITTLYEDYVTLEYFLRHIDPAKETPQLDWNRMAGTLQAAERYQINNIFKWFEMEATHSLTASNYPVPSDPMHCLVLARRYNLQMMARLSLRQLIKCRLSQITESPHIETSVLKRIISLRAKRTLLFTEFIREANDDPFGTYLRTTKCGRPTCHQKNMESNKEWKWRAMETIITEPSWSAILSVISQPCDCVPFEDTRWITQLKKVEEQIPDLSILDC